MSETHMPAEVEARPRLDMPALQGRMLLADKSFLNPHIKTDAPLLSKENTGEFKSRDYSIFEAATVRERKSFWEGRAAGFDAQYNQWSDHLLKSMSTEGNKKIVSSLQPLFERAGITDTEWNAQDVQRLYSRYLDNAEPSSGIKMFISDVLETSKKDGILDLKLITQNRESLVWLAQIFGAKSSQVIDQLIMAESHCAADPEAFFESVNQWINDVKDPEKDLMEFLWNGEQADHDHPPISPKPENKGNVFLSIAECEIPIQEALRDPKIDNIIVSASTGTGKTTGVSIFAYDILEPGEKIAVTQPRRLAVDKLSQRMSELMEVEVGGDELGIQHGKKTSKTKNTKYMLTTEGTLLRKLKNDKMLLEYKYVMVDEWHERHIQTDELVDLLLQAQELRKKNGKPPLKMIITSATLDGERLKKQLGGQNTEIFNVEGRKHEIDESFEPAGSTPMSAAEAPARAAKQAQKWIQSRPPNRHILIFMPGERTILQTQELLKKMNLGDNVVISPLYGEMTEDDKNKAMEVADGKRHIIIASPLAQTSITLKQDPDIISSGFVNLPTVDPKTGLFFLPEAFNSKDDIIQQKGRTGRQEDGYFHFLGTREEYEALPRSHPAELLRSDLSDLLLLYKDLGVDFDKSKLIDKELIPPENLVRAKRTLTALGALNADESLSQIGKKMAGYPLDVHSARMMYEAEQLHAEESMATVIAMSEQNAIYERVEEAQKQDLENAKKKFQISKTSDYVNLLHTYRAFEDSSKGITDEKLKEAAQRKWCEENFIRFDTMIKVSEKKEKLLKEAGIHSSTRDAASMDTVELCVLAGLKDNIMKRMGSYNDSHNNRIVYLYSFSHEPVDNACLDDKSALDPATTEYAVSSGNYPRQNLNGKGRKNIKMQLNQAVPAHLVTS